MSAKQAPRMRPRLIQWRAMVLGGAVIGCCLILNLVVLGLTPRTEVPTAQATAEGAAQPAVSDPPVTTSAAPVAPGDDQPETSVAVQPQESTPADTAEVPVADGQAAVPAQGAPTVGAPPVSASPTPQVPAAPPASPAAAPAPAPAPAPGTSALPITAPPTTARPTTAPPTTAPTRARPTTAPPTTAPPTNAPTTAPPTTPAPTTTPPTTAAANVVYPQYTVPGVGDVVLASTSGSAIELYAVYAGTGWVYEVEENGPRTVKIKFFNIQTEQEAEWKANLENSRIKVEN